jgi:thioredoxin reductase
MSACPLLGRTKLLVIGAGPTGVAALWFARRRGLDAVGLDAGPAPLDVIRGYPDNLVSLSTSREWEIDGLPVDCRAPNEVTREDLLSYYSRVLAYGQLRVRCRARVVDIRPLPSGCRVIVETPEGRGYWRADRVVVTSWYRRRPIDVGAGSARILQGVREASELAGEKIVILGGGLSGLEQADTLMRAGLRVALVSKDSGPALPGALGVLFRVSGSSVISGVTDVKVVGSHLVARSAGGDTQRLPCTVIVNCTGHEIDTSMLELLARNGLLTREERRQLETAELSGALIRRGLSPGEALRAAAAQRPDLSDALWQGRRGIHFVGGVHHVAGPHAGVVNSIWTAEWAVQAIAGERPRIEGKHLPLWFPGPEGTNLLLRRRYERGLTWSAHLAAVHPVVIPSWARSGRIGRKESPTGAAVGARGSSGYVTQARYRRGVFRRLLTECSRGLTVASLGRHLGLGRTELLFALESLWFSNGLTWVPPGVRGDGAAPCSPRLR